MRHGSIHHLSLYFFYLSSYTVNHFKLHPELYTNALDAFLSNHNIVGASMTQPASKRLHLHHPSDHHIHSRRGHERKVDGDDRHSHIDGRMLYSNDNEGGDVHYEDHVNQAAYGRKVSSYRSANNTSTINEEEKYVS